MTNVSSVALLVWGKAAKFQAEFEAKLTADVWQTIVEPLDDHLPMVAVPNIATAIVALVVHNASEYYFRVVVVLSRMPMQLLLFGEQHPSACCEKRKYLSRSLLRSNEEESASGNSLVLLGVVRLCFKHIYELVLRSLVRPRLRS